MPDTFILTRADIAALLPLGECIAAVEEAFRSFGLGRVATPGTLAVHSGGGSFHIKAGMLERNGRQYFAAKTNGNFPANPVERGLPTIQGVLLLCDADSGTVLAVIDSTEITALRTAAATAVAARFLAGPSARVVAVCGCGVQGRVQLRALSEVLPLAHARVHDADFERARRYAREMAAALDVEVTVHPNVAEAVAEADVCVTCTTATDFILDESMIRPGTFVAGVGVDHERKRELSPSLLAAAKVVTDLREQCARIGDLHHAIEAGAMTLSKVHADLGEVVAGARPGRETDDEIVVFDSTGLAIQDVAAAAAVYERLARHDTGPLRITFA